MNATVTSQQIKNEQNDDSILEHDDDFENDSEELNYTEQPEKYSGDVEENEDFPKVQKNTTKMTQNLRKSDTRNPNLDDSPKSWKHCDDAFIDEEMCTMVTSGQTLPNSSLQITSIDGFFNRKRGRPPKNRFVEVYKNTHQKPQAIFTSFKLEKHGKTAPTSNYENSHNSDGEYNTNEYLSYKPSTSSIQRKRLNKMNSSEIDCSKDDSVFYKRCNDGNFEESTINIPSESYKLKNNTVSFEPSNSSANIDDDEIDNLQTTSLDSLSSIKIPKIYESVDNVTVVRAAGTFYPENSNENCSDDSKLKENASDLDTDKQNDTFLTKEVQLTKSTNNDVAQNLSLKDNKAVNNDSLETPESSPSSILPQIYNVLQMQQQIFAFYHQIALMTPVFPHLLFPNSASTTKLDSTSTFPSPTSASTSTPDLSTQNKDLFNMILNHQTNQKNTSSELPNPSRYADRVGPSNKRTSSSTTLSSTLAKNPKRFEDNSVPPPAKNLPKPQFYTGKERTPRGYLRFRFNEDCGYEKCVYRKHQSHFHCNRTDCQYSFCDKTRFVQHTARHERLDTLMGSDFQQYRATMSCNYAKCPYSFDTMSEDSNDLLSVGRKSSHFHCLKCQFVCADTNKVVAHRRLHDKMEFVRSAGFRKVASTENCKKNNTDEQFLDTDKLLADDYDTESQCPYEMRHAHYHCLVCDSSVLSRSQLLAHKHRSSEIATKSQSSEAANIYTDTLNNKSN